MSARLLTSLPRRLRLPRRPRRPRPLRRPPRQRLRQRLRLQPLLLRLPSQFRVPGGGRNSSRIEACPLFTFGQPWRYQSDALPPSCVATLRYRCTVSRILPCQRAVACDTKLKASSDSGCAGAAATAAPSTTGASGSAAQRTMISSSD